MGEPADTERRLEEWCGARGTTRSVVMTYGHSGWGVVLTDRTALPPSNFFGVGHALHEAIDAALRKYRLDAFLNAAAGGGA